MAETQQITFTYKEVVESMIRQHGLTEGKWALFVKFGISAVNAGEGPDSLRPTALLPILELGLQRTDENTNLSVDAEDVGAGAGKRSGAAKRRKV